MENKNRRKKFNAAKVSAAICAAAMTAQTLPALAADTSEYATREYTVSEFVQSIGRRNLTGSDYMLSTFEDADEIDEEYKSDLSKAVSEGLLRGYDDKHLEPKGNIKRVEALVILSRVMDLNEKQNSSQTSSEEATKEPIDFTDVPQWAKDDVDKLSSKGIVEGYGNGVLGADDYITEEQVKILTDRTDELFNTVDVGDSYYGYINNKLFRNAELTSETTVDAKHGAVISSSNAWSCFGDIYNDINAKEDDLLEKLMAGELTYEQGSAEQRIHDMLLCLADSQKISDDDKALITEMRERIKKASSVEELISVTNDIRLDTGLDALLSIGEGTDEETNYPCPNIVFTVINGTEMLAFNAAEKEAGDAVLKRVIKEYLTAIDSEFSDEDIAAAVELQYTAAKNSNPLEMYELGWRIRAMTDPDFTEEKADAERERLLAEHPEIDPETLEFKESKLKDSEPDQNIYDAVDVVSILSESGYSNIYKILYPEGLENEDINSAFAENNLNALKVIALVSMGESMNYGLTDAEDMALSELEDFYMSLMSFVQGDEFDEDGFNLLDALEEMFGESAETTDEETEDKTEDETEVDVLDPDNISELSDLLPCDIGLMYCDYYYDDQTSEDILDMVVDIWEEYFERFGKNSWLSESTKLSAQKKIANMVTVIGYPDNYEYPTILSPDEGGTYFNNLVRIRKNTADQRIQQCANRDFIREMMYDTIDDVNACYLPMYNSMNIPAGILHTPIYDPTKDRAWNLGAIGAIIGHEIGHAFDTSGSQYDELGRLVNWWTEEDKATYDELTQRFIDYYKNFEVVDGVVQDSETTIGENMADFAGLTAVMDIIGDDKEAQKEALKAYATVWARLGTEKYVTDDYFLNDVHSAHNVRVDAVVASLDCFYELYDIEEGDAMYVAPEDRLKLW